MVMQIKLIVIDRGTQREYSSKPLNSIVERMSEYLNGIYWHIFIP